MTTIDKTPGSADRMEDPEDPGSILWWDDYAKADRHPVADYLFESGEPANPIGELSVDVREYLSPEHHAREVAGLWTKAWQIACRANDIPTAGDYIEYEIVGYSILIVRDAAGAVRAFHNACRHRATAVATGTGNAACFVCPFHGWTYGLDGSLDKLPAAWDFPHVDQATHGLRPVQADVFDGWVFVNLDPTAPPLLDFLGERVAGHLLRNPTERMWKAFHIGKVVHSNWKIVSEAFMETYHVSRTHPTSLPFAGDFRSRYDIFGLHLRLAAPIGVPMVGGQYTEQEILDAAIGYLAALRGIEEELEYPELPAGLTARQFLADGARQQLGALGIDLSGCSDTEIVDVIVYALFPNVHITPNPISGSLLRVRPNGNDPASCIMESMVLRPVAAGQEMPKDAPLQLIGPDQRFSDFPELGANGFIIEQDESNCALIQKGLPGLERMVFGQKQESNIVAFHRNLDAFIQAHA